MQTYINFVRWIILPNSFAQWFRVGLDALWWWEPFLFIHFLKKLKHMAGVT